MSIQNIEATCLDGRLNLSWVLLEDCEAITIQISRDLQFTNYLRVFVVPKCTGCTLDAGKGIWFFRLGHMWKGKVDWMPMTRPIIIQTTKEAQVLQKPPMAVIHTQPITDGLRFHTNSTTTSYTIIEYGQDSKFQATSTKTRYFTDPSRGYFDCEGLDPQFIYSIRLATPEKPSMLPKDIVHILSDWIVFHGKRALKPTKPHNTEDRSQIKRDAVLLREANESNKPMRFTNNSDYTKYLAAKARNTGEIS